jgi:hypothetical protein
VNLARDIEQGWFDRLLVAPVPRPLLLLATIVSASARALLPIAFTLAVAFAFGGYAPWYHLVELLPGYANLRIPSKHLALAALALAALTSTMAGGVLVALAVGSGLSLGAVIGLLASLGLAVRATVFQIKRYQQLEQLQGRSFRLEAIEQGMHEQLAPLVATALATALAFGVFAIRGELPGLEILRSATGVALGGVLASVLVCLFVVPCLFLRFGSAPELALFGAPAPAAATPLHPSSGPVAAGAAAD